MIKRLPQEIADFFRCYVVQDPETGAWYLFREKPERDETLGWVTTSGNENVALISSICIDVPADHDWTHLSEPQADNKDIQLGGMAMFEIDGQKIIVATKEKFLELQKKIAMKSVASHQSEVYTHQAYKTIACFSLPTLTQNVNEAMAEGWRPQGGVLHFSGSGAPDDGLFYQAMVRGI